MPIYEYFCPECNLKFELLRPLSHSDESAACPRCHNGARRVFSSFACSSKGTEEMPTPMGGNSPCSTCSAIDCSACRG
jgi:putative FmdB family regulatory protein